MKESVVQGQFFVTMSTLTLTLGVKNGTYLSLDGKTAVLLTMHLPVVDIFCCSYLLVKQVWKCFICLLH